MEHNTESPKASRMMATVSRVNGWLSESVVVSAVLTTFTTPIVTLRSIKSHELICYIVATMGCVSNLVGM